MATYIQRPNSYVDGTGTTSPSASADVLTYLSDNSDTTYVSSTGVLETPATRIFKTAMATVPADEFIARASFNLRWKGSDSRYSVGGAVWNTAVDGVNGTANALITPNNSAAFTTTELGVRSVAWANTDLNKVWVRWYDGRSVQSWSATQSADVWAKIYTLKRATATPSNRTETESVYPSISVSVAATIDWEAGTQTFQNLRKVTTEVRIESGGTGVGTGTLVSSQTLDTVFSATGTQTVVVAMPDALQNGTYNVYARAVRYREDGVVRADQTSSWSAAATLTMSAPLPNIPSLGVTADPSSDSVVLSVTPVATTGYTGPFLTVERSDDAGVSWAAIRGASAVSATFGVASQFIDYEAPRGVTVLYRAKVDATYQASLNSSLWSVSTTDVVDTNLVTNPSMEAASGTVTVRTNLVTNPSFETNITGWSAGTRVTTEAYLGGASLQYAATAIDQNVYTAPSVSASQTYTASAWVKGEAGKLFRLIFQERTAADAVVGATDGVDVTATGSWQRVTLSRTFGSTGVKARVYVQNRTAGAHTFYVDAVQLEVGSTASDYFDGSTAASGDFTYAWSGTAHASTSLQQGVGVASLIQTNGRVSAYQSTEWASTGTKSIRLTPVSSNADGWARFNVTTIAGKTYTLKAKLRLTEAQSGTLSSFARIIRVFNSNVATFLGASNQPPNTVGVHEVTATFTATDATSSILIYNGSLLTDVWWDDLIVVEGTYAGDYFDGDSTDTLEYLYDWTGIPHASTSLRQKGTQIILPADKWNLKHLDSPEANYTNLQVVDAPDEQITEDIGVFRPLGRKYPVVVSGTLSGWDGKFRVLTSNEFEWAELRALIESQTILRFESVYGWEKYIRLLSGSKSAQFGTRTTPRRDVTLSYVEVEKPAIVLGQAIAQPIVPSSVDAGIAATTTFDGYFDGGNASSTMTLVLDAEDA